MIDSKIMATTKSILKDFGSTYFTSNGNLKRNKVIEDLDAYTPMLMKALLSNQLIHDTYTENVLVDEKNIEVFKLNQFIEMFTYKEYWQDSYTRFENKIGLNAGNKFIDETADVVLDFPFKDTVLKAGMTKEDQKDTDEVFLNETIAKSEIDELLEPKIFKNATKYDKEHLDGESVDTFDGDNLIIKGNNLVALYSLKKRYAGKVKLIYLDPPYNTNSDSFAYNDKFNHASWLVFIINRLEIAKQLLSDDGMIFIHTDDGEQAYLKVVMDMVFGRNHYLNTVTVKTKSSSGASGGGEDKKLKKNTEFITIYQNDFAQINIQNKTVPLDLYIQERKSSGKSFAYKSVLVDSGELVKIGETLDGSGKPIELFEVKNFKIKSISEISKEEGIPETDVYVKYLNKIFTTENAQTSIRKRVKNAVSDKNEFVIARYAPISGRNKGKKIDVGFIGKTKRLVSFLSATAFEEEGVVYKTEKAGTLWDDISWASISKEGGEVTFENGEKPEKLLQRVIQSNSLSGDIVLDFFMGSATTQAVAMKMNRRFIGIEQMDYIKTVSVERLKKVIAGEQGGISKDVNWQGGGSFVYAELMEKNQGYLRDIQNAQNASALNDVVTPMLEGAADLDFRVDLDKVLQDAEYQEMPLDNKKKLLIKVLDKNQLYYSYSNIDDANVQELMSSNDIAFNKSFYAEDD
ncbi:type III restriction-modification system:methylase [Fructobacillus tropaeoli]|uniref:Type III restriction-modification system:methylase n=2 Tax=Fructobacillus tropaeoli TaxID=709323 RepID=A0A3F3H4V6_9LACO|nr:type III restriction-modification system:methylase [Fructobacillus tropaeoli]